MNMNLSRSEFAHAKRGLPGLDPDAAIYSGQGTPPLGETELVAAGRNIYLQDDPAHYLYYLVGGMVSAYLVLENGDRRVTGFLSEGDYFGAIFSERYRFSAEAVTDCTMIRYSRKRSILADPSDASRGQIVLDALRNERKTAEEHAFLLGGLTTCAKVAGFLLYLSERAAARGEPRNPVSIPMTRYDIADFLGTTPESVSRCLTKLNRAGAIEMHAPDLVTLVDWEVLADIPRGF